jgi:uncharacterized repeat protein (TIGR01451 family)
MRKGLSIVVVAAVLAALTSTRAAAAGSTDLSVSISALSATAPITAVAAGDDYYYAITVTNAGPDASSGPTVLLTLPAGVVFKDPATVCSASGIVVTCPLGGIAAGGSFTRIVQVTAPAEGPLVASVTVDANAADTDTNTADNTASLSTGVIPVHDLSVTVTASPDPVAAGGLLTYTIVVGNAGPSDAGELVAVDTIPVGTAFVSVTSANAVLCGVGGTGFGPNDYGCRWSSLAVGATLTATLVVAVTASPPGLLQDSARVLQAAWIAELDPNSANDTATVSTSVVQGPPPPPPPPPAPAGVDLGITKTVALAYGATTARIGDSVNYFISVTDLSTSRSGGFTIVDSIPAAVSLTNWPTSVCSYASPTLTCTGSGLGLAFSLDATVVASGTITNTATVTGVDADPNNANNTASATIIVAPVVDLGVSVAGPATELAGAAMTYTVTVTNHGPDASTGGGVKNTLPAGATFVSAPAACAPGPTIVCSFGALAANASVSFTIVADAPGTATATEQSVVGGNQIDPNGANDTATLTTTITPMSDIAASETASAATVITGGSITFTGTATNAGPSDSAVVGIDLAVSSGFTATAFACPGATWSGLDPTTHHPQCRWDAVATSATRTLTVTGTVSGVTSVTSIVTVGGPNFDPDTTNNSASATVSVTNTPPGTNVTVTPIDAATGATFVTVTFSSVGTGGTTSVSISATGPSTPSGFTFTGYYYEISTTAVFTPPITICIAYSGGLPAPRLFHYENGAWMDVTTSVTATAVCGQTSSLSPFAVLRPTPQQLMRELSALIAHLPIADGQRTSLAAKIDTALRSTAPASCGDLAAFENAVRAQRGKGLTDPQASELTRLASAVRGLLCP